MSAFKLLRDVSVDFENYSRSVAEELKSLKTPKPFEDIVAEKIRDKHFFTSKLRLLLAKPLSEETSVEEDRTEESIIQDYGDAVSWKIIEQQVVKAITQSHTVKKLLTTPDDELNPEYVERKEKIIEHLAAYAREECRLRSIEAEIRQSEENLLKAQKKWDKAVGKLKDRENCSTSNTEDASDAKLKKKLETLTDGSEVMRWLIGKLVTSRHDDDYDWMTDPDERLRALAIARQRDIE